MNKYALIIILILNIIFVSCVDFKESEPPETPSELLNELVSSAPYQYININEVELNEITISEEDILYRLNHNLPDEEPILGHLTRLAFHDGQFFVYDVGVNAIFIIDKDGGINGPFSRGGRGPGEHGLIDNLKVNHQFVWAADVINVRINRYTHEMTLIDSFDDMSSFLDLNDKFIIIENSNSRGIAPKDPDQGRIVVRDLNSLADTLETILPRIIPAGFQSQLYNSPRAKINHNHMIVATYQFLPWLFLYDQEFTHLSTLIIEYSMYDEMDIPSMELFRQLNNEGFGGVNPITEFKLMDNNEIFFSVRRELIHLTPSPDGIYHVAGRYRFYNEEQDEPLWISDIFSSENEGEYYIGSWYHLFRFAALD